MRRAPHGWSSLPRTVLLDDLHWLDPSSAGMVEELVRLSARLPYLLLLGTRPGIDARPSAAGVHLAIVAPCGT